MDKIKNYSENFKFQYERFITGCDSIEEMGSWDKERFGEMDAYYSNDIVSVIIRLIAADGNFSNKEVDYLNDIFGFDYSEDELKSIYIECKEGIDSIFDDGAENGLTVMKDINVKLAHAYKDLLSLVCDIIIESDGEISKGETELAATIKKDLNNIML